jgi:Mce-associated membrane protein
VRSATRRALWWSLIAVVVALTAGALAFGGYEFVQKSRPAPELAADQPALREEVVDVASAGTEAVLSYTPSTFDDDVAAAKEKLTGPFLDEYTDYVDDLVRPAVREQEVTSTATVAHAGVETLTVDHATLIMFVNQTSTARDRPTPSTTSSAIRVTLDEVDGAWLISGFAPI